ncbi:hypothetical protein ACTSKR_02390 [Chitinibacteraceae bacterium HSL-7]
MSLTVNNAQLHVNPASLRSEDKPKGKADAPDTGVPQERVELNQPSESVPTYGKSRATTPPELMAMIDDSNKKANEMMSMIRQLLGEQGLKLGEVVSGRQQLSVDQPTIDAAKEAIGEDGEFGVRKVSERILSFAKFAMQGDVANLGKIRDAIQKGFDEATEMLGGTLPDISQQTYKTIMAELDRWEKDGLPEGDTVTLPRSSPGTDAAADVSA